MAQEEETQPQVAPRGQALPLEWQLLSSVCECVWEREAAVKLFGYDKVEKHSKIRPFTRDLHCEYHWHNIRYSAA